MANFIIITYNKSFDRINNSFIIGGLETYIQDLARLILVTNHSVEIILPADIDYTTVTTEAIPVRGIKLENNSGRKLNQLLYDYAIKLIKNPEDRLIVATEQMAIKARHPQVIAIQHGIGFDYPYSFQPKREQKGRLIARLFKSLRCYLQASRFNQYSNVVCVDYNYVNWYRTMDTIDEDTHIYVIPNYTSSLISKERILAKMTNRKDIKIIFARRFVDYRGTRIFINCVKRLLKQYDCVKITFAGSGELEAEIRQVFEKENRVDLTSFKPSESVNFHFDYDIAVVPTIFSEGTSLSLCEAMAAGCLPIVTFVGGMSNMILDGYNGLMCYPSEDELYKTIDNAIRMSPEKFNQTVLNARETVECSFSIDKWRKRWTEVLKL